MSTHIITAATGQPHVTSADDGALHAAVVGDGRYKLNIGEGLKVSMSDSNTLTIATGALMMDGRFVRVDSPETVKIANGGQGTYRKDLVVLHYRRDVTNYGYESVSWEVARGTAASTEAAAKVPSIVTGNILNGDTDARVAVAEVDLAGLSPTPKLLLSSVPTVASLRDSVSRTGAKLNVSYVYSGTTVDKAQADDYGQAIQLIRKDDFKRVCGRYFDQARDVMLCMNADYSAQAQLHGLHTYYSPGSGAIWARFEGVPVGGAVRLNWLIVLGA